jgi:hypothetical protein
MPVFLVAVANKDGASGRSKIMNMQEPSFYDKQQKNTDPALEPYYAGLGARNVNADPREQRQITPEQEYQEGYTGQEPYSGSGQMMEGKIRPEQRRKRGVGWAILLLVLAVLLGLGLLFSQVGAAGSSSSNQTRTFAVSGIPKLVVHDGSGTVHIHTGAGNAVTVQATKHATGFGANTNNIDVNYSQHGNEVDVSVNQSFNFLSINNVDLDVTLPTNANMQVETGSGDVEATGVNGQAALETGSGDITTTDVSGQVSLKTGSGTISTDGLNGQVTITTGSGDVEVKRGALSGNSLLKTGSGDISYNGSLNPSGSYHFDTGSGTVNLTLPASSAFHLHTSTGSGEVNNDFGSTDVGTGQRSDLSISTGSGDINLQQGQ